MKFLFSILRLVAVTAALSATVALSSCNTMAGLGRDIGNAGHGLENAANQ